MSQADLKEPLFESDTFFRAIFYRNPEFALKTPVVQIREGGQKEWPEKTRERRQKTVEETRVKTRVKILRLIEGNPQTTRLELAAVTGITLKGVDWHISRLKKDGLIRHVGPDNGGHWEVVGHGPGKDHN